MFYNYVNINFEDSNEGEFFYKNVEWDLNEWDTCDYEWIEYDIGSDDLTSFDSEIDRVQNLYNDFIDGVADEVARRDMEEGIDGGIYELEEFGFDCDSYWDNINSIEDPDASLEENGIDEEEEDTNTDVAGLCFRDRLYRELGIYGIMQDTFERYEESQKNKDKEMGE